MIRLMEVKYAMDAESSQFDFINRVLNVQVIELNFERNITKLGN